MNRLTVQNLSFRYPGGQPLLEDISFSVGEGELISLIGQNGAGKTTLLKCLMGLLPGKGEVLLDGEPVGHFSPGRRAEKIAYIPQNHGISFTYTAFEVVLMGATPTLPWYRSPGKAESRRAEEAMETLGILPLGDRDFDTLSGGEQQLCMMARAMMTDAKVWLLDEPAANLDYGNTLRMMERLSTLARKGYCILQSIHDPEIAVLFSTRLLALQNGKLAADGGPEVLDEGLMERLYGVKVRRREILEPDGRFPVFLPGRPETDTD